MYRITKIVFIMMIITFTGCSLSKKVCEEREIMMQTVGNKQENFTENDLANLPAPVRNWLQKSGVLGKPKAQSVLVEQKFKMKLKPEQKTWNYGTANQLFTVDQPAFNWRMKMKLSPIMKIKGRDKFENGKGEMHIKLNGLFNLAKENGPKIDEGALQRFLGEMIWFPSAATKDYIQWEEVDSLTAKATLEYQGTKGSGTFQFNSDGELTRFSALRFKGNDAESERYWWIIDVKEYKTLSGIKMPSKVTVTWELDDAPWTWLDLEISNVEYNKDFVRLNN